MQYAVSIMILAAFYSSDESKGSVVDSEWLILAATILLAVLIFKFLSKALSLVPLGMGIALLTNWLLSKGGLQIVLDSYKRIDPEGKAVALITGFFKS